MQVFDWLLKVEMGELAEDGSRWKSCRILWWWIWTLRVGLEGWPLTARISGRADCIDIPVNFLSIINISIIFTKET